MTPELLGELSRVFEAEAGESTLRSEQKRLLSIAAQLYSKAQLQRRQDIVKMLGKP
jgi:hypothetical protein